MDYGLLHGWLYRCAMLGSVGGLFVPDLSCISYSCHCKRPPETRLGAKSSRVTPPTIPYASFAGLASVSSGVSSRILGSVEGQKGRQSRHLRLHRVLRAAACTATWFRGDGPALLSPKTRVAYSCRPAWPRGHSAPSNQSHSLLRLPSNSACTATESWKPPRKKSRDLRSRAGNRLRRERGKCPILAPHHFLC